MSKRRRGGSTPRERIRDVFVPRPFAGLVDETEWIALRELVPAATAPLRLRPGEQEALLGTYRLSGEGPAMLLEFRRHGGEWRRLYEFSLEEVDAGSCAAASDELNADPQWFLRRNLLVERTNPRGRWQLFNGRLRTDTAEAGEAREIGSVAGLREVLAETFGVDLAGLDGLDETLAAILDRTDAD